MNFVLGDNVKIQSSWTDNSGNPVDMNTITLEVRMPDFRVLQQASINHDSLGNYSCVVACPMVGLMAYRWHGTRGSGRQSAVGQFSVLSDGFSSTGP